MLPSLKEQIMLQPAPILDTPNKPTRSVRPQAANTAAWLFTVFLTVVVALASNADAAEYKRTIRNGPNTIILPQDAEETKRLFGDGYQYLNRDHLVFISDLDQQTLVRLALQDFQTYLVMLTRQLFTKALNSHRQGNSEIPTVFLFKDRDSYVRGLQAMGISAAMGSGSESGNLRNGYHFSAPGVSFILINYHENYAFGLSIFAHELTHALVRMEYPTAPIWLNEGLATMFENCKVEGGQLRYAFSSSLVRMQRSLRSGNALPLARLFKSTNRDFSASDHLPYYDAAELLCRYLHSRNLLIPVYLEMREGRSMGENGSETVARIAGGTLENLEKNWHEWLKSQQRR